MIAFLQSLAVILVVFALVPALAHALELPGKMRLSKDTYSAVQPIYYPGFTIAGISEPIAIALTIVLVVLTPLGTGDFWLTLAASLGLIGMHAVYWLLTHPVNKFWLQDQKLSDIGSGFFALGSPDGRSKTRPVDWTDLRNRWEYSHVARAGLAALSFIMLVIANSSGQAA